MPLYTDFPESPHVIIDPSIRWTPDATQLSLIGSGMLLPPLVQKIRDAVKIWRDDNYKDASETSKALLNWWFKTPHLQEKSDGTMEQFQYYFAQREALETIIYLYDVVKIKDKYDLMRFDSIGFVSAGMFDENWRRFVIKMATGTGKTKVMSLAIAWSFFHKLYEPDSELSRNFLVIAPNIIVLDRLYHDFQGLQIFFNDPVLPDNGYEGQNWRNDFQLTLHVQDEVRTIRPTSNIFLTNIHRVYSSDQTPPSPDDDNTEKLGKKAILFVMTDDTRNCNEVTEFLEKLYPDLKDAVLTIHTKKNGEISEAATGKKKEDLEKLRSQANQIDSWGSPYKAIVSVLMLKEGWDVKNVTTIVGLRAYSAKANILPEQTLGRGLRRMYNNAVDESVSVVGTDAFMDFVEQIQEEGVELERKEMGEGVGPPPVLVIEVDKENVNKDIGALDIEIPILTRRVYRQYKFLAELDVSNLDFKPIVYLSYSIDELREIEFRYMTTSEVAHITILENPGTEDYRNALGYFAQTLMKELRLVSGYDVLYAKIKDFVQHHLFGETVALDDPIIIKNLAELRATKTIIETFKRAINELTVQDKGNAELKETTKISSTKPFMVKDQEHLIPTKSVFNIITGDSHLELEFAKFLEECPDVVSYAKNYYGVHFKLDYVNADGDISNYYPDFIVKLTNGSVVVVETKGLADLDVPLKMQRLSQWCEDVNNVSADVSYDFVFVDEESFRMYQPITFLQLLDGFTEYKAT